MARKFLSFGGRCPVSTVLAEKKIGFEFMPFDKLGVRKFYFYRQCLENDFKNFDNIIDSITAEGWYTSNLKSCAKYNTEFLTFPHEFRLKLKAGELPTEDDIVEWRTRRKFMNQRMRDLKENYKEDLVIVYVGPQCNIDAFKKNLEPVVNEYFKNANSIDYLYILGVQKEELEASTVNWITLLFDKIRARIDQYLLENP